MLFSAGTAAEEQPHASPLCYPPGMDHGMGQSVQKQAMRALQYSGVLMDNSIIKVNSSPEEKQIIKAN